MEINLQPFIKDDFDRLISWIPSEKELVQFAGPLFTYPLTTDQLDGYIKNRKLQPKKIVIVESNQVIGHCELNFSYNLPCLSRILIGDTHYRGKGLGKQLISIMIEEILKVTPTHAVELRVYGWNINAIKLYEKQGFAIQPDKTSTFKFREDEIWDSLYMIKNLS
ncbi:GNAT family N-acetyltransferase [Aquimarina sp. ERC-38]|uniref:GNAT family N-acetyltransferase n=1 Tax=Aquimarina sp. ERC-38 TaxID=2949996 RepID=UPI00224861A6|nr:GNAT family protein [Aquimarina sp. ERC-38]UZO80734.1 GNAT family N-acetyltransferase [Aquimarina sp. ERC-38]